MTKQRASAIGAGFVVTILLWVAALSNGLGSNGAAAATTPATRSTPVAMPGSSVSGPGTSYPARSTASDASHETGTVVGFGDGAGGDD